MELKDLYAQKMEDAQNKDKSLETRLALQKLTSNLIPSAQVEQDNLSQVQDIYTFPKLMQQMAPKKKEEEQSGL